jgi:hypothetical protein
MSELELLLKEIVSTLESRLATNTCLTQISLHSQTKRLNKIISELISDEEIAKITKKRYKFLKEHKLLFLYYKVLIYGIQTENAEIISDAIFIYIGSIYGYFMLHYIPYCQENRILQAWASVDKRSLYFNKYSHLEVVVELITTYLHKYKLTEENSLKILTLIVNSCRSSLRAFASAYYKVKL